MSCEEDTATLLRRAGHKLTPQRLMIVRALRHGGGHLSATQIADDVKTAYPMVDVSTVYRTLDVLRRVGLASSTDMGTGDVLFEWRPPEPHHHLICSRCGRVVEVEHGSFRALAAGLDRDYGFAADLHHFAIFGLCRACRVSDTIDAHET